MGDQCLSQQPGRNVGPHPAQDALPAIAGALTLTPAFPQKGPRRHGDSSNRHSFECGRKPESPEKTHADAEGTCKLHTDEGLGWE